jgi:hypothetical protein
MIENIVANRELFPHIWQEGPITWLMPIAPELKTKVWPVSLMLPSTRATLPELVLASNGSVKSNEPISQQPKLLAATNAATLFPWLVPYRTIGVYMNGAAINFVDITSLKQTEEKLRRNQEQLESLNKDLTQLVAERTEQVRRLASEVLITEC